jgi:ribonuclease VapC
VIVVDTSALMAVLLGETEADLCIRVLEAEPEVLISAGTLGETLIVAGRRGLGEAASGLVEALGFTVSPVTAAAAQRVADAYARWGKGLHPAALNFGDCFAYALARDEDCPLLYVGEDFRRTDIAAAAPPAAG